MSNPDVLDKINRESGMTVPDGYFEQFCEKMRTSLPEREWEGSPIVLPRTKWQKIRPYVYMAAMFAGIWCMMKMFDLMRPDASLTPLSNATLISAINNDDFYVDYCYPVADEDMLYDQLYDSGVTPEDIE